MSDHPRIKICGITSLADAHLAAEAGAWALGMIFWPGSPRSCTLDEAQAIGASLRRTLELVGVFVNAQLDEIAAIAQAVPLSLVQLHGDEGPAFCTEVARRTGAKIIKATRVRSRAQLQAATAFHTDFHLLDAYVPDVPGGTGATFDWELAATHRFTQPVILSGGLTPDNVAAGIAATQPFAVDTASGTERSPGVKDPDKLLAFVAAVRATGVQESGAAEAAGGPAEAATRAAEGEEQEAATRAAEGEEQEAATRAAEGKEQAAPQPAAVAERSA